MPDTITMVSPRGTACTVPAHMGPQLIQRGYTALQGEAPQLGAVMREGQHLDPDGTAGYQPGKDANPFA